MSSASTDTADTGRVSVSARILVAEDDALVAMDLRESLESMGYEVPLVVHSAEEALEAAKGHWIDLAVVDIRMPGLMDGVDAAWALRGRYDVPVVFVTAHSDERTLARAKDSSPYGYLVKPVNSRELRTTVEIALYRHQVDRLSRRAESRFEDLFHRDAAARFVTTARGSVLECNDAFARLLSYRDGAEAAGHVFLPVELHDFDGTSLLDLVVARGRFEGREMELTDREGRSVRVVAAARVLQSDAGDVREILWSCIPLSDRS